MGECQNCDTNIDYEYKVTSKLQEFLDCYNGDKEEVKVFLNTDFDWSIDQACDACYHTYWVPEDEKAFWYSTLDTL